MHLTQGMGHARLVAQEGCEVHGPTGVILWPRFHLAPVPVAPLVWQEAQVSMSWSRELPVGLGGKKKGGQSWDLLVMASGRSQSPDMENGLETPSRGPGGPQCCPVCLQEGGHKGSRFRDGISTPMVSCLHGLCGGTGRIGKHQGRVISRGRWLLPPVHLLPLLSLAAQPWPLAASSSHPL